MTQDFDFEKALEALKLGAPLNGKEGILTPLVKKLTEAALEAEIDSHLGQEVSANRRNGKTTKTIKASSGSFELSTPRDRSSTFEPGLIKKHQTSLNDEIETKIISMFGLGMSYRDISGHIKDLYGISISVATLSAITDKIIVKSKLGSNDFLLLKSVQNGGLQIERFTSMNFIGLTLLKIANIKPNGFFAFLDKINKTVFGFFFCSFKRKRSFKYKGHAKY